jgi:hypothetical protein
VRDLHVLGVTDDGRFVLLGVSPDAARPSHRVPADERLRAAIRGELSPPGRGEVQSALPPRDIQARLRAGETPEQVARAAGVPVVRVLRYAGPVVSERQQVVDAARSAVMHRPRRGDSAGSLGVAVDQALDAASGLRGDTVDWSARRRPDGAWVVSLQYVARGRTRRAEWLWQAAARSLTPLDPHAAALGFLAGEPKPRAAGSAPARTRAPAKAPTKRTAKTPTKRAAKSATKRAAKTATKRATTTTAKRAAKRTAKRTVRATRPARQSRGRARR